jgi:DNA-binding transcriptional regulator YhcF (GntR family)
MNTRIRVDRRFAIIDEWVLDLDISDRALRLYAILMRYADKDTHKAFPSRKTLAERLKCSPASVDRASMELVEAALMSKEQRYNNSLVYTLHTSSPVTTPIITHDDTLSSPVTTAISTGDDLTITTKREPKEQELLNDISTKFDQFWEVYPRKVGKGKARQAFEKALEKTDIDTILAGVQAYVHHEGYNDMEFIAHPTSWLNGERWDDEYETPMRKETPTPGKREWVREMHEMGEHWACEPGEFAEGCG